MRREGEVSFPCWPPRNLLWSAWRFWARHSPVQRGKYRTAKLLETAVGLPVVTVQGVVLELFPPSAIDGELIERGDFDTIVREAIEAFVGPGDVFLDVGANIGWFTLVAAVRREAEVWAFEPSERERRRLERNIGLNACSVHVQPFALGSTDSELPLVLAGDGNRGANRLSRAAADGESQPCPVRRLLSVVPVPVLERVRLVKLDVEGWEVEVLKGFGDAFESLHQAAFVVEVSPQMLEENGSSVDDLYGILEARGWRPREPRGTTRQWDAVFLRPKVAS